MAKTFEIRLTKAGEKKANGTEQIEVREVELAMLTSCFELAASKETDKRKQNCIIDVLEQIENLSGDVLELTKDDLDRLDAGKAIVCNSQQGMPIGWLRFARSILRQLENPTEQVS
jgi:serine phosphatase RsbU (regulator of sigma subunit)